MLVVNVQRRGNFPRTKPMRRDKTSRMIDVCGGFPAKRDTFTQKEPASPLETKVSSTGRVKLDVIVSRLIVTHCVIKPLSTYLGKC